MENAEQKSSSKSSCKERARDHHPGVHGGKAGRGRPLVLWHLHRADQSGEDRTGSWEWSGFGDTMRRLDEHMRFMESAAFWLFITGLALIMLALR